MLDSHPAECGVNEVGGDGELGDWHGVKSGRCSASLVMKRRSSEPGRFGGCCRNVGSGKGACSAIEKSLPYGPWPS